MTAALGSRYGRSLDRRMKKLIQAHKEGLGRAKASGDLEAEKYWLEGCQYIDTLGKGVYSISQEFDTLPPEAEPLREMTQAASAKIFEASIKALEIRTGIKKRVNPMNSSMGAVAPLTESSFYSDGIFHWYNPADWIGKGEWEAYHATMVRVNAVAVSADTLSSSAQEAANKAGSVVLRNLGIAAALGLAVYAAKNAIQKNTRS